MNPEPAAIRIRRGEDDRRPATRDVQRLRRQFTLVALLATLAFLVMLLPLPALSVAAEYYYPMHVTLEFLSVVLVVRVFSTVWHTPAEQVSISFLLIWIALFASGWLDVVVSQ